MTKYGCFMPRSFDRRPEPAFNVQGRLVAANNNIGHIESKQWIDNEWWYVVNGRWEAESCLKWFNEHIDSNQAVE